MPGTINALNCLFTEEAIRTANKAAKKNIPESHIYRRLAQVYQKRIVPTLSECTQNETATWIDIAEATRTQAIQLIHRLASQKKSLSELMQVIHFQRALLGREPDKSSSGNLLEASSSIGSERLADSDPDFQQMRGLRQPLIIFLKNVNQNITPKALFRYAVPYKILFELALPFAADEILETLKAAFIKEPEKFHDALIPIMQQDPGFIERLSPKFLRKILCRLEFSGLPESNRINEWIFERLQNKIKGLNEEGWVPHWKSFLDNANPSAITKILSTLEQEKSAEKELFKEFVQEGLAFEDFKHLIAKHTRIAAPTSMKLIKELLEIRSSKLNPQEILKLCQLDIKIAKVFFAVTTLRDYMFLKLSIADFAVIAVNYPRYMRNLLEVGVMIKTCQDKAKAKAGDDFFSQEVIRALSILLSEKNAEKTEIFNFIYKNQIFNFLFYVSNDRVVKSYVSNDHFVKSLSHRLDSDDIKLKSYFASGSLRTEMGDWLIERLEKHHIFQIFLEAQKNHYVLPTAISNVLMARLLTYLGAKENFIEAFNEFLEEKPDSHLKEHLYCRYTLILEAHKAYKANLKNFNTQYSALVEYLRNDPNIFNNLIFNRANHDHLIAFLGDENISNLLEPESITEIFFLARKNKLSLPVSVKEKLLEQFLKKNMATGKFTPARAYTLLVATPLLPYWMSRSLFDKLCEQKFKGIIPKELKGENNNNARSAFLLTAFLCHESDTISVNLKNYLQDHPEEIAAILLQGVNQPHFNFDSAHLLRFIQCSEIIEILRGPENSLHLKEAVLNTCKSQLDVNSQIFILKELVPHLSQDEITQIFSQARIDNCVLDLQIRKMLVERLDFKKLHPHLHRAFEKYRPDNKTTNAILNDIFVAQIERQKDFSIPAFVLSVLYGIFYYLTLGWLLHFVAPVTRPSYFYKFLRGLSQPVEVARIKHKAFKEKTRLANIADEQLSETGNDLLINDETLINNEIRETKAVSGNVSEPSIFDPNTGEIEPFPSESDESNKANAYMYLFPRAKERLNSKAAFIESEIKSLKEGGAVFCKSRDEYSIGNSYQKLTLPDAQKQQLRLTIKESENKSRSDYKNT